MNPIRARRHELLLTQAQLAYRARLAVRTVVSAERGASCHMATRRALLRALKIPFERWREFWPTEPTEPTHEETPFNG